ncbi:hypothetical protein E3N88_30104 [Mikania micrantha]|uniref:Uncharacterized protein n=1 Tax=Mikania micrantha TaxID=192012 RepID=A0A5N6MKM5_9ASTR|nr:hypothetical protein E3N88_30104 [Mikania micrantha]
MPHLRSHGPPPELSLPSRSDSRDFSEGSTSEVSASTPISVDISEHTPSSSSSSSTHSSPRFHFVPPMAARRTVHQQATAGFTGLNNPITPPPIPNENSDDVGVHEVVGGGPWDVGDCGLDEIVGEEISLDPPI